MKTKKLHIISTGKQKPEQLAEIIGVIHPYIDFIHLREKTKRAKEVYEMVELLADKKVPLSKIMINDRVDVACASNVKGVQLAYHSLPVEIVKREFMDLTVGCSVHSIEEAQIAEQQGADYVIFGHVYSTQSKPGLIPKGIEQLWSVSESVSIPVIAIGGITPTNSREVIEAGAQGVAVMSGILEAEDPLEAVKQYRSYLSE
ncbi:thiazole tautomerase TenI [Planococcus halotolerans]|uniref:Thiamine-phosphate synthase n=1 Tax=Planococcus halotolerans TaxID=2233542 RepID=A0A365L1I4_9BACL|nr:thiazole tautomerase TenI [Planococcus halotolerans]RAZ79306.1 thiazole tautomerase TenI [Planococcus halotolerans]